MMFTSSVRCRGCNSVFCCSKDRRAHQERCRKFLESVLPNLAKGTCSTRVVSLPIVPSFVMGTTSSRDIGISMLPRKRKLGQPGSPAPASMFSEGIHNQRIKLKAVRKRPPRVLKVPTLESVKEENEEQMCSEFVESAPGSVQRISESFGNVIMTVSQAPVLQTSAAYKDFEIGALKDSPIQIVREGNQPDGTPPTVTERNSPNSVEESPVILAPLATPSSCMKPIFPAGVRSLLLWQTPDVGGFKTSTPKDAVLSHPQPIQNNQDSGMPPPDNTPKVTAFVSPLTPLENGQSSKRKYSDVSGTSTETPYYSARTSFSPYPLTPLDAISNPPASISGESSILISVKDIFKRFVNQMPGSQVPKTPPENRIESPLRKRIKVLAVSKLRGRPTYRNRYKPSSSY